MSVVFYRGVYHVEDYLLLGFVALSKWREKLLLSVLNDLILFKLCTYVSCCEKICP